MNLSPFIRAALVAGLFFGVSPAFAQSPAQAQPGDSVTSGQVLCEIAD